MAAATYWTFIAAIALTIACGLPGWLLSLRFVAAKARILARERALLAAPLPPDEALPRVLVQVPVYCEPRALVERAVAALAGMEWPRSKLEIQILDDSPPAWGERPRLETAGAEGAVVTVVRRSSRDGYKAGALAAGLRGSHAEFVAIFDVDYQPAKDWLKRAIRPMLGDPRLAFVQTRLTFLNADENALTRALALNTHFSVWQAGMASMGLPVRCNGTGALWRAAAIREAGGWCGDTLAEDLDISCRAFLGGWRSTFLHTVTVPGELPADWRDWRRQQYRWSKGSAQALLKGVTGIGASLRWRTLAFLLFLAADALFPSAVGLAILSGLWFNALTDRVHAELVALIAVAVGVHIGGYAFSIWQGGDPSRSRRRVASDAVRAIGFELSVLCDRICASVSALTLRTGEFVRTRKSAGRDGVESARRISSRTQ